jgi:predicted glycosyltransferase
VAHLAGPNVPDAGIERLLREAGPSAIVERSRADFGALLRRAFISISQGGYNTVLDVVTSGARPVVVPFTGNGETEQRARGVRLAQHDLAIVVDDRTYTPEILAAAVDEAGTREDWGTGTSTVTGASRSASIVSSSLPSMRERTHEREGPPRARIAPERGSAEGSPVSVRDFTRAGPKAICGPRGVVA